MHELSSFLSNAWTRGSGAGTPFHNPTTGEVLGTATTEGLDLGAALQHAREVGGPALRALTFAERGKLLEGLAKAIHAHRQELVDLSAENLGATRGDAKFDVDGAAGTLAHYAELGAELGDRRVLLDGEGLQLGRSPRFHGQHVKLPRRGVAVHINAFNFPAWGMAEKMACSLLAGMPVLEKPATSTALVAHRLAQVFVDSGLLPEGAFSFLCGGVGDLLAQLTTQDVVAFTGSAKTAQKIRSHENLIRNSVPVNVEADSLNAVVVGPDVEVGSETWNLFLGELAREMTLKAGQKCTATRRVFLPESLLDAAVEGLKERLGEIPMGRPTDEGVRMGPLSVPSQFADVVDGLKALDAVAERVHGEIPTSETDGGAFVAPVVFVARDLEKAAIVHDREVFGPVVTLMPYDGTPEAGGAMVAKGQGCLVATAYSDELDFLGRITMELVPWAGRVLLGGKRIAEHSMGPGIVLPSCKHGGPGRAGGGTELGGLRGLDFYMQTTAVQGPRPVLERILDA